MPEGIPRILVVEDEQSVRRILTDYFHLRGFQVAEAEGGEDALVQLGASDFDLVISDLRMPGVSGMDLLSEIDRLHKDVGVVMLTGCEDVSLAVQAMKLGA